MRIKLENVGKRYKTEWILKKVNLDFRQGKQYAITGPNGSGKSTLLKMLSGHLTPSKGKVQFELEGKALPIDQVYQHLSYAAPYIDMIEELTLWEALQFHSRFKSFQDGLSSDTLYERLNFRKAKNKPIRAFSSGMKQRLKLLLAICSDSSLLLLDEPTTNLDTEGINWYRELIEAFASDRLLIIASNVEVDFDFCGERVSILDFK